MAKRIETAALTAILGADYPPPFDQHKAMQQIKQICETQDLGAAWLLQIYFHCPMDGRHTPATLLSSQ